MVKQATRLSDFQIPRAEGLEIESKVSKSDIDSSEVMAVLEPPPLPQKSPEALEGKQVPEHPVFPVHITPRPAVEPRQALTVRLPVSMHERIRLLMFTSRRSQQDIVEEALHAFLTSNGM